MNSASATTSVVLAFALAGGLPAMVLALVLLFTGKHNPREQWTLAAVIVLAWLICCFAARDRVASPLRTLASLLEAMREGDYSIRARVDALTKLWAR